MTQYVKISKDFLRRKKNVKKELKNFILKSVLSNRNIKVKHKLIAALLVNLKSKSKFTTSSRNQNVCIYTQKSKTTFKFSNASRWLTKKFNDFGLMQGIRRC